MARVTVWLVAGGLGIRPLAAAADPSSGPLPSVIQRGPAAAEAHPDPATESRTATVTPVPALPSLNDLERARAAFERGVALAQDGRWHDAVRAFTASARLAERPNTLFNLALSHVELDEPLAAFQTLTRFLELTRGNGSAPDRQAAQELLEQQRKRLTQLRLRVAPAHAAVFVDGHRVDSTGSERSLTMRPGEHAIRVAAAGRRTASFTVTANPGATLHKTLRLLPETSAAARADRGDISPAAAARSVTHSASPVARAPTSPPTTANAGEDTGWLSSPWFWATVVVVVATGAVATGVAVATAHGEDGQDPHPFDASDLAVRNKSGSPELAAADGLTPSRRAPAS